MRVIYNSGLVLRVGFVPLNMLKHSSIFFKQYQGNASIVEMFMLSMFHVCFCYATLSVPCSLAVTCCQKADLLALLCVVYYCVLLLSHMVSQIRCGAYLYRLLIKAFLFAFMLFMFHVCLYYSVLSDPCSLAIKIAIRFC